MSESDSSAPDFDELSFTNETSPSAYIEFADGLSVLIEFCFFNSRPLP